MSLIRLSIKIKLVLKTSFMVNRNLLKLLFLFTAISMNNFSVFGQEKTEPPFQYIRIVKDENNVRSKIEFWDSLSSVRKSVLDLYAINPFGKFDAKFVKTNDFGIPIFQLDTLKVGDTLNGIELVSKTNFYKAKYLQPFELYSSFATYVGHNIVAIGFELTTLNKTGRNISTHSMIQIYNSEGQLLHKTPVWDINLSSTPVVTEDARFIAFKIGGPYGWEQGGYIENELWVYDCLKREVIFKEKNFELGMHMEIVGGKLINDGATIPQVSTTRIFYDFYSNIKYMRVFSFAEMPYTHSTDLKGVYFLNEKGEKYLKYMMEIDFLKVKIF